ncbi:MAG: glutathione S-transferase family protein [Gammaproteobacteria bacterium]
MLDLYFAPTPNGWKITILLEELQLPYQIRSAKSAKSEPYDEEFLAISPNHRIPILVDPKGPDHYPLTLFESGAIMIWLAEKQKKFLPATGSQRYRTLQWLFWQIGGQTNHFAHETPDDHQHALEHYSTEFEQLLAAMERDLDHSEWLAGDYSIADMSCFPWVLLYQKFGKKLSTFPQLSIWFERMKERPGVQAGVNASANQSDRHQAIDD